MMVEKISDKTKLLNYNGLKLNEPKQIIIHSTRSYPEFEDVMQKHILNKWAGVGYHLFLSNNNNLSQARPFNVEGAHAIGFNLNSIGFCIYSSDGFISKDKINISKDLIKELSEKYNGIPVISHLQAQIKYINKLLKQDGFNIKFQDDEKIVLPEEFSKLKTEVDGILNNLSSSQNYDLKQRVKSLVNCPGELYLKLI